MLIVELLLFGVESSWSAVTVAVLVMTVLLSGVTTILTVAVEEFVSVPIRQVTMFEACEHVPAVVVTETNWRADGNASTTVTLLASAGPLLVTVRVYARRFPCATGLGAAVLTIETSALFPVPTVNVAVAALFARVGSLVVAATEAVSAMTVPDGVLELICTVTKIGELAAAFSALSVQVKGVVDPTAGGMQVHAPAANDWKVVLRGIFSVSVRVFAVAGPLFVTFCEKVTFEPAAAFGADGELDIARSACVAVATTVVVVAVLFAAFESVVEVTTTLSVMIVPDVVPAFT